MPSPHSDDERLLALPFPTNGIDRTTGHDRQPPGTTPHAENVRVFAPLGERDRGGSRPGLLRWIDEKVGGFSSDNVIQHLAGIVWTNNAALLSSFEHDYYAAHPSEGVPDPSTNFDALDIPYPPIGDWDTDETPYTGDPFPIGTDPNLPRIRNPDRQLPPGGSGVPLRRRTPNPAYEDPAARPSKTRHYLSPGVELLGTEMALEARDPPMVGDGPPIVVLAPGGWDPTLVSGFLVDGGGLPTLAEANAAVRSVLPITFDPYTNFYDE